MLRLLPCLFLLLFGCAEQPPQNPAPAAAPIFTLVPAEETGIEFVNRLTEGPNTNILVYEYFYNGGGVAAGDLNGDGKPDLYFSANMAENNLYLNRGDWQFENITLASQAGGRDGPWKTGVTMVDINADGKLDIYLCYSGALPAAKRANQLFINQGNNDDGVPTFNEEAAKYGLASTAYSNQLYFFDYDGDGDLDGLLLNHNPKALPLLSASKTKTLRDVPDSERGLRLYKNNEGKFIDVTENSGISGSALSYGLGLGISDLDEDGDPDFYVSNDYEVPDYLYYNNGDGTFTDRLGELMGHTSHFSMGNDIGDVNNDGRPDIFTLDMLPEDNRRKKLLMADDNQSKLELNLASGFHHQTMRNMLHLNREEAGFAEVGQFAGVATTDWSWSALLADFDNDGWRDLHVTNGYLKDYTNMDFIKYMEDFVAKKGRLQRADLREILEEMPASDVSNCVFRNNGDGTFSDHSEKWGLRRPSNSNGAAYADLDGDGDLDLITNNIDQPAFVYRNDGPAAYYLQLFLEGPEKNLSGIGARVEITTQEGEQMQELYPARGYLSSVEPILHFGLGALPRVQSLRVTWPDGKRQVLENISANQRLTLQWEDATGAKQAVSNIEPLFVEIASPIDFTDKLSGQRDFDSEPLLPREYSHGGPYLEWKSVLNNDLNDIMVNTSRERFNQFIYRQRSPGVFDRGAIPSIPTLSQGGPGDEAMAVSFGKYPAIFSGNKFIKGRYPVVSEVSFAHNAEGGPMLMDHDLLPASLQNIGKINTATWADLDGDGAEELLIAGEWTDIKVYTYNGKALKDVSTEYFPTPCHGWWNALLVSSDLNGDGRPDIIAGNEGLNNLHGVTPETPMELHAADLDNNGTIDPILSYYGPDGKRYPDATRDELLGQLASMRKRYPNYESYAEETLSDVFPKWPGGTLKLKADRLATTLYLSQADGTYAPSPLPRDAQYAPIHTITELDFNDDGHPDLLLCGNERLNKQRWGKSDANAGLLLEGDGGGGFTVVPQAVSGFQLGGDVRSVLQMGDTLLFGIRGEKVRAYRRTQNNYVQ